MATCLKLLPEPGKVYHVIAQVFDDHIQMFVNGEPQFDYREKTWLPDLDSLGFQVWGEAHFDNVRIYAGEKD